MAARFADHFTAIVKRTGTHNQNGDLFANFEIGCDRFSNHEVSGWLEQSADDMDRSLDTDHRRHSGTRLLARARNP